MHTSGKICVLASHYFFPIPCCSVNFFGKDADSDIRLMRRIARDTKERGRTVEDILQQYHATVRPMHDEYVEPSKLKADLIVHSTGHSMETAIKMLKNHIQVEVGIL
jgi:uridine kinase